MVARASPLSTWRVHFDPLGGRKGSRCARSILRPSNAPPCPAVVEQAMAEGAGTDNHRPRPRSAPPGRRDRRSLESPWHGASLAVGSRVFRFRHPCGSLEPLQPLGFSPGPRGERRRRPHDGEPAGLPRGVDRHHTCRPDGRLAEHASDGPFAGPLHRPRGAAARHPGPGLPNRVRDRNALSRQYSSALASRRGSRSRRRARCSFGCAPHPRGAPPRRVNEPRALHFHLRHDGLAEGRERQSIAGS